MKSQIRANKCDELTVGFMWFVIIMAVACSLHADINVEEKADPIQIGDIVTLQRIGNDAEYPLNGNYILTQDINALATKFWNDGAGFQPIGTLENPFAGTLDGQGYVISNLVIRRPAQENVGLFGFTTFGSQLARIGIEGGCIEGKERVGALIGSGYCMISECHATTTVLGQHGVGGLVGGGGSISDSYATGTVTGVTDVGGLVGYGSNSIIRCRASSRVSGSFFVGGLIGSGGYAENCQASGTVSGIDAVGGLVGSTAGSVTACFTTNTVSGLNWVGGLVGYMYGGQVARSYAAGAVDGRRCVGGLVGFAEYGWIEECYAVGAVSGTEYVGGLAGSVNDGEPVFCYAVGPVSGASNVGGLTGFTPIDFYKNSFWNIETSGQTTSASGAGLTTAEMLSSTRFLLKNWRFSPSGEDPPVWAQDEGVSLPYFYGTLPPATSFSLNIAGGNGSVTILPQHAQYPAWSLVTITAEPAPGYAFAGWIGQGLGEVAPLPISPLPIVMRDNMELQAVFIPEGPIFINSADRLQRIGNDPMYPPHWEYLLTLDIDATETAGWNDGAGFLPIGVTEKPFTGVFDGQGNVISNLTVNRPWQGRSGLFGFVNNGGEIKRLALEDVYISSSGYVASLVGVNDSGALEQCYATGTVISSGHPIGGLVGYNIGAVNDCYNACNVYWTGTLYPDYFGGLIGTNEGNVSNCYASALVSAGIYGKGLFGSNWYEENVLASFYDGETCGCYASGDEWARTTAEMKSPSTFTGAGWDFATIWGIEDGLSYPYLLCFEQEGQTLAIHGRLRVEVGESLLLSLSLPELTGAYTIEWYKDGILLDYVIGTEFYIPSVGLEDAGIYHVIIIDEGNIIYESPPFVLQVFHENTLPVSTVLVLGALLLLLCGAGIRTGLRLQKVRSAP